MTTFTTEERKNLTEKKEAMPDGSYPIRNRSDLKNAISSYGRAKNKPAVKKWIIRRAKELDCEDLIPENWQEDMKHIDNSEYLIHYGVLGMKWGVRKQEKVSARSTQRKRDYQARKRAAASKKSDAKKFQNAINDLKKNGYKSKAWKNSDYKDYWQEIFDSKSEAKKSLIRDYENSLKDAKNEAANWDKLANKIKSTPLNKKTYLDVKRRKDKIVNGMQIAGTILGTAGSIGLGVVTKSPSVALGSLITTGILGGWATDSIRKSEVEQYNKMYKENLPKTRGTIFPK